MKVLETIVCLLLIFFNLHTSLAEEGQIRRLSFNIENSSPLGEFQSFLIERKYAELVQQVLGQSYQKETLFELPSSVPEDKLALLQNEQERNLVKLFFLGAVLKEEAMNQLNIAETLVKKLRDRELLIIRDGKAHLNGYSIYPVGVGRFKPLFILTDTPADLMHAISPRKPTALLSTTSFITRELVLKELFFSKEAILNEKQDPLGIDFGSGTGIQSFTLMKLFPKLQMIGVEIDAHSMKLAAFSAEINGMKDRFIQLNNARPENLTKYLKGKKADFAISNPPFNIVPPSLSDFTAFGGGGIHGLEITKLFLKQSEKNVKRGGAVYFYSQLSQNKANKTHLEEWMMSNQLRQTVTATRLNVEGTRFYNMEDYAQALVHYMDANHLKTADAHQLQQELETADVHSIAPYWLKAEIGKGPKFTLSNLSIKTSFDEPPKGGAYIQETIFDESPKGGVYLHKTHIPTRKASLMKDLKKDANSSQK